MALHGFEGRLMSEPRVFAAAGHRCAATVSSTGGEAQAGDAVKVMIQRFDWSRADLAYCSHHEFKGEVEDSDVIVAGIAFILSRARHICMLCDNWPVIWTGVSQ